MNTKSIILWIIVAIMIVIGVRLALSLGEQGAIDHKNAEYVVDGRKIQLTNGVSVLETKGGVSLKITTRYFGNEVVKDFNGDGRKDVAFLLTKDGGGSGTFYYVVAALNTEKGYIGSEGFLLGDRIAPQTTESGTGDTIIVNYADRAPNEPMTADPSIGKSVYLKLDAKTMKLEAVK